MKFGSPIPEIIVLEIVLPCNRVHATSGSDEKAKLTESLGVTTGSTTKSALELKVNKGVDIIIDFVGKDYPGGVGHGRVPVVLELIVTYFYVAVSNLLRHVDRIVVEKFDLSILWEKRLMGQAQRVRTSLPARTPRYDPQECGAGAPRATEPRRTQNHHGWRVCLVVDFGGAPATGE
ncbi:hypothetical protein BC938DRAFT_482645 [Jimgerdemannia flammicorona]|uniref:Alcohol dehydrogenase-like C-terminal domain-containing protein n=1 Tax=Jimgerdemannia flammicorona TaxID=994334 RepID=A0A433QDN7_9FUNG|nr:hypothetical protein BC938DRAFT_482645 [Jimgerdemannia flammicorona]